MRFFFLAAIITSFSLFPFPAFAQARDVREQVSQELQTRAADLQRFPSWLLVEKGRELRTQGRISDAFTYFFAAQDKMPQDPGIDFEIAKAYLQAGDMPMVHLYLDRAIEKRMHFSHPQLLYDVYYFRSDLAWLQEEFMRYELELLQIIRADQRFMSQEEFDRNLRRSYLTSVLDRGLNRSLVLYRIPDSFSLEAHRRLGVFYVQSGRFQEALPHLIFSTIMSFTRVIEEYRKLVLDFEFSTIADFMERLHTQEGLRDYLYSVQVYQGLYYLAEGIYGYDRTRVESSREIWRFLSQRPDAGPYQSASISQLANPQTYLQLRDRL